jgi:CTP synthase (UTP-ammonia lyase)
MHKRISIGLIGDYDKAVPAHQAIPLALQRAAEVLHVPVTHEWVPTEEIAAASRIASFSGFWCVPASPYRSMEGALLAIRHARESGVPFLGTCGGFQHAIIEYARNVLGWADAEHAETAPDAARAVISLLECTLEWRVVKRFDFWWFCESAGGLSSSCGAGSSTSNACGGV